MSAIETERVPQLWDSALLAADLRLRFVAAHARLRQAQLILSHRDYAFPKTLDSCLDDAEHEVDAALRELDGGISWEDKMSMFTGASIHGGVVPRTYIPDHPLTYIPDPSLPDTTEVPPVQKMAKATDWPEGFEKTELRETVALLALGMTMVGVAAHLYISVDAVKSRLAVAYRSLDISNQPRLIDHAWRVGLMDRPEMLEFQKQFRPKERTLNLTDLAPRRYQLLVLLAAGRTHSEMAEEIGIETATVKAHLAYLFRAMGMKGKTAAGVVNRAWEIGFLPPLPSTQS